VNTPTGRHVADLGAGYRRFVVAKRKFDLHCVLNAQSRSWNFLTYETCAIDFPANFGCAGHGPCMALLITVPHGQSQ
jgi:hypothetical protein